MSASPPSNSEPKELTRPDQELPDWAVEFSKRAAIFGTPLQLWSPPEDPDKPKLPYLPGLALQIDRHVPPGSSEDKGPAPKPHFSDEYLESLPQSELVMRHPPMETAPPANPERAQLVVTTPIAIGASRGAQVVGCTIYPQSNNNGKVTQPFQATAKIYDPLYYDFKLEMTHHARDIIFDAENDYSTEARAYEHLLSAKKTGSFAPAYYGSWTFSLPISINGKSQTRSVRLILIERLHGTTIEDTRVKNSPRSWDSFHYPEQFRLEVLAQAMEGFASLLQIGLDQRDLAGRNVFLVQNDSDPFAPATDTSGGLPLPRIVLIDYNHARITPLESSSTQPPLQENPVSLSLRTDIHGAFAGWPPREWEDEKVEREWLLQRFYNNGQSQLYLPLDEWGSKRLGLNLYQDEK